MATIHTFFFSLLGAAMWFAPAVAPAYFPPGQLDGANTSALWLQVMGVVNFAIGVTYLVHLEAVPFFARTLEWSVAWGEEVVKPGALRRLPSLETLVRMHEEPEWRTII